MTINPLMPRVEKIVQNRSEHALHSPFEGFEDRFSKY